jgi:hypothetical protein
MPTSPQAIRRGSISRRHRHENGSLPIVPISVAVAVIGGILLMLLAF